MLRYWMGLLCCLMAMPGMAVTSKASKTLLVYESIGQAPNYSVSFRVYSAALGFSAASGLSFNLAAAHEQAATANAIAQLPVIPALDKQGRLLTQSALLNIANQMAVQYAQTLAGQMAGTMQTAGAASGIFNYAQQVRVQGNAQPMYLVWQELVDVNGRPRYGNFVLQPGAPNYLYGNYTSLAVANTLPASFAYPQGGQLVWQQVKPLTQPNQAPQAMTTPQTVNVNGAFDAPVADQNATTYPAGCQADATGKVFCDPDYGLKCLINHASDPYSPAQPNPANPADSGCPATPINGFTDFVTILNQNGASAGYLDYVRSLSPVYTYSTNAQGQTVQTAQVSVSVDSRLLSLSKDFYGCAFDIKSQRATCTSHISIRCSSPTGMFVFGGNAGAGLCYSGDSYLVAELSPDVMAYGSQTFTITDCPIQTMDKNGCFNSSGTGNIQSGHVNGNPATGTFTNAGHIGYQVQSTVDRYYVTPDGAYSAIATTTMPSIAPTQSYNKSVALPQGANAASYTTLIIDPFNTTQIYDYTNDTVNGLPVSAYVYVAPLQAQ